MTARAVSSAGGRLEKRSKNAMASTARMLSLASALSVNFAAWGSNCGRIDRIPSEEQREPHGVLAKSTSSADSSDNSAAITVGEPIGRASLTRSGDNYADEEMSNQSHSDGTTTC